MQVDLNKLINKNDVVAVATSGGSDSMALLYYLHKNSCALNAKVIALNVEHGIRGQNSVSDTAFVKDYCAKNGIPCLTYKVDSLKKAKDDKLSVEQAARALRYECFFDAINTGKCTKVATAHHARDNLESVLFNLFRGAGASGLSGINENYSNKIIRPFLHIEKDQLNEYVAKNHIPFVVDETNADDKYTRNFIRLNILPKIKEIFPDAEKSVARYTEIAKVESDYLNRQALLSLERLSDEASIKIPLDKALFNRAVVFALKHLGVKKDWEKAHIDAVFALIDNENAKQVNLLDEIVAVREYDKIVFYREQQRAPVWFAFEVKDFNFGAKTIKFTKVTAPTDLKDGLYFDLDKIPADSVIRYRQEGDRFTKFGGGTKDLNDYLCDKKIPLRMRNSLPILASGNKVLFVLGVAISNDIKVDNTTKNIIKFTEE